MNLIPPCFFAAGFYFHLETSAAAIMFYKYCRESTPTPDITGLSRVEMLERWCALKWASKPKRPGSNPEEEVCLYSGSSPVMCLCESCGSN